MTSPPQHRMKVTRTRQRLSCLQCRRRKQRCDRALPCNTCRHRPDVTPCTYAPFAHVYIGNGTPGPTQTSQEHQAEVEARLEGLEQLVRRAVAPAQVGVWPASPDVAQTYLSPRRDSDGYGTRRDSDGHSTRRDSYGHSIRRDSDGYSTHLQAGDVGPMSTVSGDQVVYGPSHWSAVWEEFKQLRVAVRKGAPAEQEPAACNTRRPGEDSSNEESQNEGTLAEKATGDASGIIFGTATAVSLDQVLGTYLPARDQVNRYVAAYFRAQAIAAPFIHAAQFKRLYDAFWADPAGAPPLFVSMIFSICHVAAHGFGQGGGKEGRVTDIRFTTAAAHCLALGEYSRPQRFAVEALLLYIHSRCLTSVILSPDIAISFGVVARTATMMGYHRDPALMKLSPFEAEMRRRVWMLLVQLDLLVSFHLGIPSAVQVDLSSLQPPRSLYDSDFDEGSTELPPSRPDSELTGILFCMGKHRFMGVFNKVLRHALTAKHGPADMGKVDALDAEVKQAFADQPDIFKSRAMADSVLDPTGLIVTRLCVLFIYCKCLCVLHRPYIAQHRVESIRTCYDASFVLLRDFLDAYKEFGHEGQAGAEGWFISSLTWHDFLLAVVTLCLVTVADKQRASGAADGIVNSGKSMNLLRQARDICVEKALIRGEKTERVHLIINATLQRLEDAVCLQASARRGMSAPCGSPEGRRTEPVRGLWDNTQFASAPTDDSLWDGFMEQYLDLTDAVG